MRAMKIFCFFFTILVMHASINANIENQNRETKYITIAILAKDKAHTLPFVSRISQKQTWPADKTYLYIRTNNNNDETVQILCKWIVRVGHRYADVYLDESDVEETVQDFKQHEWNVLRFRILGKIRQDSINWAHAHHSHYFVADCDNFIHPQTIEELVKTNLPIVAPFLKMSDNYAILMLTWMLTVISKRHLIITI